MKRIFFSIILLVLLMQFAAISAVAEGSSAKTKASIHDRRPLPLSGSGIVTAQSIDPLVTASALFSTNLILNPDFESGDTDWSYSDDGLVYNVPGDGNSKSDWFAYLGGADDLNEFIFQQVTIPADATAATFNFYYNILVFSDEPLDTEANDQITVKLIDAQTASPLATLATLSNLDATEDWVKSQTFNLLAYKGKTLWVMITATTNESLTTGFLLDDVALTVTVPSSDSVPPSITSIQPANGAIEVATNVAVKAVFSEAMDAATINDTTFFLQNGDTPVAGTVSYNSTTKTASFVPDANLDLDETYTATITTEVEDSTGTALSAEKTWSFTTVVGPPTLTSTSPEDGATDVGLWAPITATFSRSMDGSTINTDTFTLDNGVAGTLAYNNTTYTATLTDEVEDASGIALETEETWSFTTLPIDSVIAINNDAEVTKKTAVTLTLAYSGAKTMRFSTNNTQWTAWEAFKTTRAFTLPTNNGTRTVYVRFKNASGKVSPVFSDSIVLDTGKPGGGIKINDGDAATTSAEVNVTLAPTDAVSGVAAYCLSNASITSCSTWTAYNAEAATIDWTLAAPATDGTKTVYALFKDNGGNVSATLKDTIILDGKAPTGSVKINNGAAQTGSTDVTLNLTGNDGGGSGVANIVYSTDGAAWSDPVAFAAAKSITLPAGDGTKTVYVKFIDKAGNTSEAYSDTIILDATLPTGTLRINDSEYTRSTSVNLYLTADDGEGSGISQVRYGNNGTTWGAWEAVAAVKKYTLTAGNGTKTVYAQLKDKSGNISDSISDTIVLDAGKPTDGQCTAAADDDNALAISWTAATDANDINAYQLYYSNSASPKCSGTPLTTVAGDQPRSYTHTGLNASKTHYYRVCAVDNAGNVSTGAAASGKADDAIAPTDPQLSINNDAAYTKSVTVTLGLGATDVSGVSSVCLSNTETCTAWQAYAASKTFTLTSGQGLKTVYVRYKDSVGNISNQISGTITLDTEVPTGQVVINEGDAKTKTRQVALQLSAADNNAVASMQFSNNGKTWSVWEDFTADKDWTLAGGADGARTVSVRFKDPAGNVSAIVKDAITLDTTTVLTISTAAFTTSLTGKVIGGTKEAGATVGVKLNDDALDDSLITQTLTGTTWSAQVGPFTETSNVITVTAVDDASNEAVKTLAAGYQPFVVTDLSGQWFFVTSGFTPYQYTSWTGYGLLTVADTEVNAEDFSDEVNFDGSYSDDYDSGDVSGSFRFDSVGLLSGNTLFQGDTHDIATGKMDDNRSMVTMLVDDTNNEMITAVKKGSGFLQGNLTGTWYVYGVSTSPDFDNSVEWGTLVFDGTGKITSGTFTHVLRDETSTTITYPMSGTTKVAADGGLSGSMSLTYRGRKYSTPYAGQMSTQKNMALIRSSATVDTTEIANKMVLVKGGGTFTTADLNGRWRFEGIYNSMNYGEVYSGYVDIVSGKLTGGEINGEALVAGMSFAISSAGVITPPGALKTVSGVKYPLKTGKLDSKKNVMALTSGFSLIVAYAER